MSCVEGRILDKSAIEWTASIITTEWGWSWNPNQWYDFPQHSGDPDRVFTAVGFEGSFAGLVKIWGKESEKGNNTLFMNSSPLTDKTPYQIAIDAAFYYGPYGELPVQDPYDGCYYPTTSNELYYLYLLGYPSDSGVLPATIYFGVPKTTPDPPPFLGEDYSNRKLITVKKEFVTGSPTNVHVMAEFAGRGLEADLLNSLMRYKSGALLKVLDVDNNELPYDVGILNSDDGALSVRLFFIAPALSSANDTLFYLDYGNRNDNLNTFGLADVWAPTRSGVWHRNYEVVGDFATYRDGV